MIAVHGLSKRIGPRPIVDGVDFEAANGRITGLLGPRSNAHGPNEFLHIETGKRLTSCVAKVLEDHFNRDTRAEEPVRKAAAS